MSKTKHSPTNSPQTRPTTPNAAQLQAVADYLDHVIAHGEPQQVKALLHILIAQGKSDARLRGRNNSTSRGWWP